MLGTQQHLLATYIWRKMAGSNQEGTNAQPLRQNLEELLAQGNRSEPHFG